MKTTRRQILIAAALICVLALTTTVAQAGEIGHFAPGVANIRDYTVPDPGFYGVVYDYWYSTDRLNDRNGNKVSSVTVNPRGGPGVTLSVDVNVDLYAVSPVFIWVSDWKVLGAKYAAYIAPSFANASVGAALATASGRGISGENDSQFGVGDLFVQPLWLGWSLTNWDLRVGLRLLRTDRKIQHRNGDTARRRPNQGGVGGQHRAGFLGHIRSRAQSRGIRGRTSGWPCPPR